jgi:hypothetical protein
LPGIEIGVLEWPIWTNPLVVYECKQPPGGRLATTFAGQLAKSAKVPVNPGGAIEAAEAPTGTKATSEQSVAPAAAQA